MVIVKIYDGRGREYEGPAGPQGERGPAGPAGPQGEAGATPVKGVDYFTDADKAEMVAAVLAAIPTEEWVLTLEDDSTVTKKVPVME